MIDQSHQLPLATHWPFKVGDLIWERPVCYCCSNDGGNTWGREEGPRTNPNASVTELTPYGFKYAYTHKVPFITRDGSWFEGGECYEIGYDQWKMVDKDTPPEPRFDQVGIQASTSNAPLDPPTTSTAKNLHFSADLSSV